MGVKWAFREMGLLQGASRLSVIWLPKSRFISRSPITSKQMFLGFIWLFSLPSVELLVCYISLYYNWELNQNMVFFKNVDYIKN